MRPGPDQADRHRCARAGYRRGLCAHRRGCLGASGQGAPTLGDTLIVPARFCGPAGAANGGYLAGLLAARLGGEAEVTLRQSVPLERSVVVEVQGADTLVLRAEGAVVAEAARTSLDLAVPPPVSLADAETGARRFPRFVGHPIPRCFVCGPERAAGDGLRIFPGPVDGRDIVAAPWTPDASLADGDGATRSEVLWAALDCTGAFAVNEPPRGLALLGRIAARVVGRVAVGTACVVIGWSLGGDGRKLYAGTAIFTTGGALCAAARATWILVAPRA